MSAIRIQLAMKRALDVVGSVLLLALLAPLLLLIAGAIRMEDGGPVLFRQDRAGRDGRIFRIEKFRTMVRDADRLLDEAGRAAGSRVTRVGALLRRTSLDELPQLLNILRGDMSFVGPRPVLPVHLRRYDAVQMGRFEMRPGVTGLAQVNGRNTLPWSRRLEFDVQYVRRFSLLLDAQILVRTVRTVLLREGVVLDRNPDEVDDLPPPRPPEQASLPGTASADPGSAR